MKLKLKINRHTTESELVHLGMFFTALGLNRGARVTSGTAGFTAPTDPAELDEGEVVVVATPGEQQVVEAPATAGTEAPKRRRRSKEEIAAEALAAENARVAAAEAEAQASNEAGLAEAQAQVGNADPAPTQPATETTLGASQAPAETAAATVSPSEPVGPVTHADAQKQAIDIARRFGPDKVKAIIGEYEGATKIADLAEGDLAGFVAKLQALAVAA